MKILLHVLTLILMQAYTSTAASPEKQESGSKPNIILIFAEDISTELSCYGFPAVSTPNIDLLAKEGTRFNNCFTTAPSCAPARSAMMTGCYQTTIGAQDQRMSDRWSTNKNIKLNNPYRPFTALLREAGYNTVAGCGYGARTDCNFNSSDALFSGKDWSGISEGKPFFAQITLTITHRSPHFYDNKTTYPVDSANVVIPPYYPNHPVIRKDLTAYLDNIQVMDQQVGEILKRLEKENLSKNTVVIFMGDNGRCLLRGKCWLYDPGIHVPLIIRWPGNLKPETVNNNLISHIDITAAILDIAGVDTPLWMHGRSFFKENEKPREAIFAARDRIDDATECIRCVRTKQFKYIRNLTPEQPRWKRLQKYEQNRKDDIQVLVAMKELNAEGKLTPAQAQYFQVPKPTEELYDLQNDPYEINNLANNSDFKEKKDFLIARIEAWMKESKDPALNKWITQKN